MRNVTATRGNDALRYPTPETNGHVDRIKRHDGYGE